MHPKKVDLQVSTIPTQMTGSTGTTLNQQSHIWNYTVLYKYTDVIFALNKDIRSLSHYFTVLMIVSFCSYINKGHYIYIYDI